MYTGARDYGTRREKLLYNLLYVRIFIWLYTNIYMFVYTYTVEVYM